MVKQVTRPKQVTVGPFVFNIVWSQEALMKFSRSDGIDRFGQTHMDTLHIYIDDSRPLVALQNTLLHEILHALVWVYDIPFPYSDNDHKDEETFVCRMDSPLLQCFKENQKVFDWLRRKSEDTDA